MVGNKIFFFAFLLLYICGCTNDVSIIQGRFLCVTDSKPWSDSLYTEYIKEGNNINPRYIELQFVLNNETDEKIYLPIKTFSDTVAKSSIEISFIDKSDTIHPHFFIKKSPCDSNYLCKGDSMTLFITISHFQKWSKKGIDVNTDIDTILDKIYLEYIKSPEDLKKGCYIPDIVFERQPLYYYEIPQDKSILKKLHRDRVLVRQSKAD